MSLALVVALLVVALLVAGFLGVLAVLLSIGKREHARSRQELNEIHRLSAQDAERQARSALSDSRWRLVPASALPASNLPAAVAVLLKEFEEVARGEFSISRASVSPATHTVGYVRVGADAGFCELMVRGSMPEVYSSYGAAPPRGEPEVSPTVWHKVLEVHWQQGTAYPPNNSFKRTAGVGLR